MKSKNRAPSLINPAWLNLRAVYDCDVTPDTLRKAWKATRHTELIQAAPVAVARIEAETLRWVNPPSFRQFKRMVVDALLETHGIEYLGENKRTGESVYYCNAGDTYAATVIFCGGILSIGCCGDWIESNKINESA